MSSKYTQVPIYKVDLDSPPQERWVEISLAYKDRMTSAVSYIKKILGSASSAVGWIAWIFSGYVFYIDELRGISRSTSIPLEDLIIIQLCYEAFACCTSVIYDKTTKPFHYRTMDWDLPALRDLTIQVEFVKNKRVLYRASTWAGYVGIMTAVRKNIGTVSLNFRRTDTGSVLNNLYSMIGGSWPAGFLIRHAIESADSYDQLVNFLSNSDLISPCYFIVGGVKRGSSAVLMRDRNTVRKIKMADVQYVQTNIDYDKIDADVPNILMSRERIQKVHDIIGSGLEADAIKSDADILSLFDTPPIINYETVYISVMRCDTGSIGTYVL